MSTVQHRIRAIHYIWVRRTVVALIISAERTRSKHAGIDVGRCVEWIFVASSGLEM